MEIGLLIVQSYAITLGEEHVHLVKVKSTTQAGIYIAEQPYSFVTIAVGTYGIEDLPIFLKKLKSVSGYALLTQYHHVEDEYCNLAE